MSLRSYMGVCRDAPLARLYGDWISQTHAVNGQIVWDAGSSPEGHVEDMCIFAVCVCVCRDAPLARLYGYWISKTHTVNGRIVWDAGSSPAGHVEGVYICCEMVYVET